MVSDGAFSTGKELSNDIRRHYLHNSETNFWVRCMFLVSSVPGGARATALVYYLRSGTYLGPEMLSIIQPAGRIRAPVLLISGERDWIVPTVHAKQILAAIPDNRKELVIIPGAQHDTTYSAAPEIYASKVLSFLGRYIKSNKLGAQ